MIEIYFGISTLTEVLCLIEGSIVFNVMQTICFAVSKFQSIEKLLRVEHFENVF